MSFIVVPGARALLGAVISVSLGAPSLFGQLAQPLEFKSDTMKQADIGSGQTSLLEIRKRGTGSVRDPVYQERGLWRRARNPADPTSPGRRPTLQNNGKFLRVNGLDAQTCMECHSILSNLTVPFTFGIGGVGGSNANAMFQPTVIDVADTQHNGFAVSMAALSIHRFCIGSGGVELLAKEMTQDLQSSEGPRYAAAGRCGASCHQGSELRVHPIRGRSSGHIRSPGSERRPGGASFWKEREFANVRAFDVGGDAVSLRDAAD